MNNETNLICNSTLLTPEQELFFEKYKWWMETLGHLVLGCFGIVINCITIFIMSRPNMRKSFFNCLLLCLAVFDSLYLCCEISEYFRHVYNTMVQQHVFVNFVYPIRNIFMCTSIYIIVALSYERYQALINPATYRLRTMTNMSTRLFRYIFCILIFNVILYAPKFNDLKVKEVTDCSSKSITNATAQEFATLYWELYYNIVNNITIENTTALTNIQSLADENCTTQYILSATEQRHHYLYVFWYINIINIIFTVVIPIVFLVYLNYNIAVAYQRFEERQPSNNNRHFVTRSMIETGRSNDIKKSKILFLIVLVFILCHSIRITMNIIECVTMWNMNIENLKDYEEAERKGCTGKSIWTRYAKPINRLFLIINATINFFIYVLFDKGFKEELQKVHAIKTVLRKFGIANSSIEITNMLRTNNNNIEMSTINRSNL